MNWQLVDPSGPELIAATRTIDEAPTQLFGRLQPRLLAELKNVELDGRSTLLCVDGQVMLCQRASDIDEATVFHNGKRLIAHGPRVALIASQESVALENGIYLGGPGSFNWYHWLIEILPKILYANRFPSTYDDLPFLVPMRRDSPPQFREALNAVDLNRRLVYYDPEIPQFCERLVYVDSPAYSPHNFKPGSWPDPSQYVFNRRILREFAARIKHNVFQKVPSIDGLPTKFFLTRPDVRRSYNQTELGLRLAEIGYESVRTEEMPFVAQVHLFHNAREVIGASGAAWSNILFSQNGCRGLSWLPNSMKGFSAFSNLADIAGTDLRFIFPDIYLAQANHAYETPYELDIESVIRSVPSMWES